MSAKSLEGGSLTIIPDGKRLVELRQARHLLQREVEVAIDIPNLRLSLYERDRPCPLPIILKLAKFYGVEPKSLAEKSSVEKNAQLTIQCMIFQGLKSIEDTV